MSAEGQVRWGLDYIHEAYGRPGRRQRLKNLAARGLLRLAMRLSRPARVPRGAGAVTAEILARAGTTREELGRSVRENWIAWARMQPHPKPSWLVPFGDLSAADQEADMAIGEDLFAAGWRAAGGSP